MCRWYGDVLWGIDVRGWMAMGGEGVGAVECEEVGCGCWRREIVRRRVVIGCVRRGGCCWRLVGGCRQLGGGCRRRVGGCLRLVGGCLRLVGGRLRLVGGWFLLVGGCFGMVGRCSCLFIFGRRLVSF